MSKQMWTIEAQWSIVEVLEVFDNFQEGGDCGYKFFNVLLHFYLQICLILPHPHPDCVHLWGEAGIFIIYSQLCRAKTHQKVIGQYTL
jgi:hypothetical protein